MTKELIEELRITLTGKLVIRPSKSSFGFIYRTASGVSWDENSRELVASKGASESYTELYKRMVESVISEYSVILYTSGTTRKKAINQELNLSLLNYQSKSMPSLKSNAGAILGSSGGEVSLGLSSFERFSDDSGVRFLLNSKAQYFEIRDFEFYADVSFFSTFLPGLKTIYSTLSGTAKLAQSYEDGVVQVSSDGRGHIGVDVEAVIQDGSGSRCKIHLDLDQSYLPQFIQSLRGVYVELGFGDF